MIHDYLWYFQTICFINKTLAILPNLRKNLSAVQTHIAERMCRCRILQLNNYSKFNKYDVTKLKISYLNTPTKQSTNLCKFCLQPAGYIWIRTGQPYIQYQKRHLSPYTSGSLPCMLKQNDILLNRRIQFQYNTIHSAHLKIL